MASCVEDLMEKAVVHVFTIGINTGLNIAAYLSANPTAHVISFERDVHSYSQLAIQSLQRLFPRAKLQLITESLRDLCNMKVLADPDWHIVVMDKVNDVNSSTRQAWLEAQFDGVIERVDELDDLLLPHSAQRNSPLSVQYSAADIADTVTVLINYTDVAVGRYRSSSQRKGRQHLKRRVRIHSDNGDVTAELYVHHTLDHSGA
eukprot:1135-Heterococcus_DN1.PRE.5